MCIRDRYVPVTQLDLLSRYTAPGDADKVKLAHLGGTEWTKTCLLYTSRCV